MFTIRRVSSSPCSCSHWVCSSSRSSVAVSAWRLLKYMLYFGRTAHTRVLITVLIITCYNRERITQFWVKYINIQIWSKYINFPPWLTPPLISNENVGTKKAELPKWRIRPSCGRSLFCMRALSWLRYILRSCYRTYVNSQYARNPGRSRSQYGSTGSTYWTSAQP